MWSTDVGRQNLFPLIRSPSTPSICHVAARCDCRISFWNWGISRDCRAFAAAGTDAASRPVSDSHHGSKKIGLDAPLFIQFLDAIPQDGSGCIHGENDANDRTIASGGEGVQDGGLPNQQQLGDKDSEGPGTPALQQEHIPSQEGVLKQPPGGLDESFRDDEEVDDVDTLWNEFELDIGKTVDLELDFLEEMFPAHRGLLTGRRVFSVGRQRSMLDRIGHSAQQATDAEKSSNDRNADDEVAEISTQEDDPEQSMAYLCGGGGDVANAQLTDAAAGDVARDVSDSDHQRMSDEQKDNDMIVGNEVTCREEDFAVEGTTKVEDCISSSVAQIDDSLRQTDLSVSDRLRLLGSKSATTVLLRTPESIVEVLVQELVRDGKDVTNNLHDIMESYSGKLDTVDGNAVIRMLGQEMHFRQAFAVFEWMRSHDPPLVNARSYSLILPLLGRAGMIRKARLIFENMKDNRELHCVQVYNSYIGVLLDCGRQDEIDSVLSDMETWGIKQDAVTYSLYINRVVKEKRGLKEVLRLYDTMLDNGVHVNTAVVGSVVKAFCGEGRFDDALVFVKEMETSGMPPNTLVFNTLIDAFGKAGKLDVAEWLLAEMKKRKLRLHLSTYNTLLNVYGKQGRLEVVEELFTEMQDAGLQPDVVTFTTLINSYAKKKMSEKAAGIFARMRKAGISPNAYTYTALIHAYSEDGWHTKAAITFDNMKREGITPTAHTYTALLEGYRTAGDVEQVRNVWAEMKSEGCQGTRITYNTLLDAFAKQGHYKEARDVVYEYTSRGFKPNHMTYNMLINAYGRGGNHEKIPDLVKEMQKLGLTPDAYTYCSVIYAFFRMRDFTNVYRWFDTMLRHNKKPDPQTFSKLAALVKEKRQIKAEMKTRSILGQEKRESEQGQKIAPKQGGKKEFWKTKKPRKAGKIRLKHKPKAS